MSKSFFIEWVADSGLVWSALSGRSRIHRYGCFDADTQTNGEQPKYRWKAAIPTLNRIEPYRNKIVWAHRNASQMIQNVLNRKSKRMWSQKSLTTIIYFPLKSNQPWRCVLHKICVESFCRRRIYNLCYEVVRKIDEITPSKFWRIEGISHINWVVTSKTFTPPAPLPPSRALILPFCVCDVEKVTLENKNKNKSTIIALYILTLIAHVCHAVIWQQHAVERSR